MLCKPLLATFIRKKLMTNDNNLCFTKRMTVYSGLLVFFALAIAPETSLAADYCYRHIKNDSNTDYELFVCNTHDDCSRYAVNGHSSAAIAIPDDVKKLKLRRTENGHRDVTFQYRSGCQISRVDGHTLHDYWQKDWITVNEPADGDIYIHK